MLSKEEIPSIRLRSRRMFKNKFIQDIFYGGVTVFCCVSIIVFGITMLTQADPVTTSIGEDISTNDLFVAGMLDVTGNATFDGNVDIASLDVTGISNLSGDVNVGGNLIVSGSTSFGDATFSAIDGIVYVDGTAYSQDSVGIQAAIDALPATGGKVILPAGTYNMASTVRIAKSNVTLEGVGEATKLFLANGVNAAVLEVGDGTNTYSNINISTLQIDGNRANNTWGSYHGIVLNAHISNSKIERCFVHDTVHTGISVSSSDNNIVTNNVVKNAGSTGIGISTSYHNVVSDNVVYGCGGIGISLWSGDYGVVSGNSVSDNGYLGMSIYSSPNSAITGNSVYSNDSVGILIDRISNDTTVTGNAVVSNVAEGIKINRALNVVVSGNTVKSNGTGATKYNGVYVYSDYSGQLADRNIISDNDIYGNGGAGKYQVSLEGSVVTYVNNNKISDNSISSGTTGAGIINDGGTNTSIAGNYTGEAGEGLFDTRGNSTLTVLAVMQNGTGDIVDFKDGATSVFKIVDGGNITMSGDLTTPSINNIIHVDGIRYAQDGTGIQAAIDALPATGGKVILPEGTYPVSATITFSKSNVTLEGVGKSTIIRLVNGYNADISLLSDTGHTGIVIDNLAVDANQVNQTAGLQIGISLSSTTTYARIEDCWISGASTNRWGIDSYADKSIIKNCVFSGNHSNGSCLHISGDDNTITGNTFVSPGYGLYEQNSNNNVFSNNNFNSADLRLWNSANNMITGNKFHSTVIYLRSASNSNTVTGNSVTGTTGNNIHVESSSYNSISGNALQNTTGTSVYVDGTSIYNNINGNDIRVTGSYGIAEAAVGDDYNSINNNIISGATVAAISSLGPHTTISGNRNSSGTDALFDIVTNSGATQTALQVTQNGTGDIVNFKDGATSVFKIVDGGNVTMSGNLTTPGINNVVYVDGVKYSQDSTGIQAAIDALPASGGKVVLPSGTYNITATITIIKSNVALEGVGETSNLFLANGTNTNIITVGDGVSSFSNISISNLQIDGNAANNTDSGGYKGILFNTNITKSRIEKNYIHDFYINNHIVYLTACSDNLISDNYIAVSSSSNSGLTLNGASYDNRIIGNHIDSIYGNSGILLSNGPARNVVEGNVLSGDRFGITLLSANNNTVVGNSIEGSREHGIWVYYGDNNNIVSNTIKNSSQSSNNSFSGIYLTSTATYNKISDNYIHDSATNKARYGVAEEVVTDDYNTISNNTIVGAATASVYSLGVHDSVFGNKTSSSTEALFDVTTTAGATQTVLSVIQNGTGDIVDFKDGATSVFKITDGGDIIMSGNLTTSGINNIIYVDGTKYAQDGAGIQAAIDALPATGGKVVLPAGTYNISSTVIIAKNNVILEGVGDATKLVLANAAATSVLRIGDGVTSYSNIKISSLQIDGNKTNNSATSYGIYVQGASGVTIEYPAIESVYIHDMYDAAVRITYSNKGVFKNNKLYNNGLSHGEGFLATDSSNNVFDGNIFQSNRDNPIYLMNGANNIISNNQIVSNGDYGFYIRDTSKVQIINNVINSSIYGVEVYTSNNIQITGNAITGQQENGVRLYRSSYNIIKGNTFKDNGQAVTNTYYDILITDDGNTFSTYNVIEGNTIRATAANKTKYGIYENAAGDDYNFIGNNTIIGPASGAMATLGIHDTISGNKTSSATEGLFDIAANSGATQTALMVTQSGTGDIVDFKDGATSVFKITDGGNIIMSGNLTTPSINTILYVDGTKYTKDSTGIQAAIDALPAEGGKVILPAGTYDITATVNIIKSNVTIEGVGESSKLSLVNSTNVTVLKVGDGSNSYSNIQILNLQIDGNKVNNSGNIYGILFDSNISKSRIENNYIHDIANDGIVVSGGSDNVVKGNEVSAAGYDGILITGSSKNIIESNKVIGSATVGINIGSYGSSYNVVNGNYIEGSGTGSVSGFGINIWRGNNNAITSNVLYGNLRHGIATYDTSYNTISSNTITNSSQATNNTYSGIYLQSNTGASAYSKYNLVSGNTIYESAGNKAKYGIEESEVGSDYNTIQNNIINGPVTGSVSALGAHTSVSGNKTSSATEGIFDIVANSGATQTALQVAQNGTGNIIDLKDGATSVFKIADGGNVTMTALSFTQNVVNPVLKGSLIDATNINAPRSTFVSGEYAYVAVYGNNSLAVVDISNPSNPAYVSSLANATYMNGATAVYVSDKYAYVAAATSDSLAVVDISNPYSPTLAGSLIDANNMDGARSIYISGKYAYVAGLNKDSLAIVDISNPTSPVIVGSYINSTYMDGASSVYVSGKYAYVVGFGTNSLAIVDISNPALPTLAGYYVDAVNMNSPYTIYISGKYAYVGAPGTDSLVIIDISNPASPSLAGYLADSVNLHYPSSVHVSGKYAYVTGYDGDSIAVVDVSTPASPVVSGVLSDATNMLKARFVYISGKYAYVTGALSNSLAVIDLAGFDLPTANIGDLNVSSLDVVDNASIANNLYVGNGLNVGVGGIYSNGPLTIAQNGNGVLMDAIDSGVSIFKIGESTVAITRPLDLQVEGDVGVEYNLNFLSTATSYITSAGALTIAAGDSNSYENLTLTTGGTGDVIIDISYSLYGFRVVGSAGKVFGIDGSGNVTIGGVDSNDADLTVKRNITTQGGNIILNNLAIPTGVAVTPVGTAGATTYGYRVSAVNGNGETLAATTVTTATGNATLSASAYNRITWNAVAGATGYKIYGRTSGSELYMVTVNSPTLNYSDTGAATPSGALPTSNTTGGTITYPASDGPLRTLILQPANATLPTVDGATINKVDATNSSYSVADYNDTTNQSAYWSWTMPDSYDGGAIDVTYYWSAASTTGNAIWCFQSKGIATDGSQALDTALGSAVCSTSAAAGSANYLTSKTQTEATSNFTAGQYVTFKVYRNAADGSDDMTGDARLVKIKIEYHVKSESD